MAGHGSRFAQAGYTTPKWLISAKGKTLLEWSVDSLPLDIGYKLIFIALKADAQKFRLSEWIHQLYDSIIDVEILLLDQVTRGQAETVLFAESSVNPNHPIGIFNIDTRFTSTTLSTTLKTPNIDGVLGAFSSNSRKFSYARLNKEHYVQETAEKVVISSSALTGFYSFSKAKDFFSIAQQRITQNQQEGGEYYIAPMYNDLIQQGKKYILDVASEIDVLGTPEELDRFLSKKN